MKKDFISVTDAGNSLNSLLVSAGRLKAELKGGSGHIRSAPLKHRNVGMIFEKSSTRTRVSFEVGVDQLGGHALYLNANDLQLGRGETVPDTARVLSRFVDCIVYRAFDHEKMKELAQYSSVPVVNALDDVEHPCQTLADLQTIRERFGRLKGLRLAYVGDGNNVCHSLMLGAAMSGMNFIAATPSSYAPSDRIAQAAAAISLEKKCTVEVISDPQLAVRKADVIYTDVWVSMGQESETKEKEKALAKYQVNSRLVSLASKQAIVMHCLPAHRGMEITEDVIEGPKSVVFDQAENRLHAQKALLLWLMKGAQPRKKGRAAR